MTKHEANPKAQMTNAKEVSSFGLRQPRRSCAKAGHFFGIRHSAFVIPSAFHSVANWTAAKFMKLLFGYAARVRVLRRENADCASGFLLAANHISHFDPLIISSVVRRKIDWMAMAEFFPMPIIGPFLRAVDAFPADRDRADRATIRTAIARLKDGRVVGLFPEGGIRSGKSSVLEDAPLRPGVSTLAHIAAVPVLPCVIIGSDRLYGIHRWLRLRSNPIWIAFGDPVSCFADLPKSIARQRIEHEVTAAFQKLYLEIRDKFQLTPDDLPHSPQERMKKRARHPERSRGSPLRDPLVASRDSSTPLRSAQNDRRDRLRHIAATAVDSLMCASINLLQSRHRLHARSRDEMERYVSGCEKLTVHEFYAAPDDVDPSTGLGTSLAAAIRNGDGTAEVIWRSPIETPFSANNVARVDFFWCARRRQAPTAFMLHALMSATHIGYRRWAGRLNELGWNACFVHLPYHYSRVPRGYWNGELAITADLIRNAEGLRQGVIEVRQLMAALREIGCHDFGVLGTSYGAWIGALLACVESDLRFVALMAPIVNVEHAIWESPASIFMRRELRRSKIEPSLIARHFHLSSAMHNQPLCSAERVLFVSGEFDLIARPKDIEQIRRKWAGSELLRVRQGHFGYRMLRETMARLKERGF